MIQLFLSIYHFFESRRLLLFSVFILILSLFLFVASKITLEENIMQMLPHDKNSEQLNSFMENSKFSDRIMVVISDKDTNLNPKPEKIIEITQLFADTLNQTLGKDISSLNYRSNDSLLHGVMDVISNHLPVFLEEDDFAAIDSLITAEGIKSKVASNYRTLVTPSGLGLKQYILNDPLGLRFIALKKLEAFKGDEQVEIYDGYYLSSNHHHALLFFNPALGSAETKKNSLLFHEVDLIIEDLSQQFPDVSIHYFGAPAVAAGNADQIRKDTFLTISITIIILVLIFLLYFRKFTTPVLILVPVVFGGLFALTVIYFLKGSISVISLGAGSLILGIAVNYSLHFLTHYRNHPDIRQTIKELAFPMTAGSLTTIGGFLCLQFVNAPVLQDLGLYAALSLAGAALATLIFLPHLISRKNAHLKTNAGNENSVFIRITESVHGNKKLALIIFLATPFFLFFTGKVEFETDMYKVNYMSKKVQESESFINQFSSYFQKSVFVISTGSSIDEALVANEKKYPEIIKLFNENKVLSFTNVSSIFPSAQEQKRRIERWNNYWTSQKNDSVFNRLVAEGRFWKFRPQAFDSFNEIVTRNYATLPEENIHLLRSSFLNNFIEEKNGQFSIVGLIKTTPEYSGEVYSRITPDESTIVFDRKFITDKLVEIVTADFNFITLWTSLLVFIALLTIYGRIELALISFLPMVLSWIWILGLMALFDIKFNIINIVLSTLIFALGDDFCIFTTDGLKQKYARAAKTIQSTGISITLSAITTVTGMGVLIFAKHPALQSIALVSIIGIFSVWLMSQVLQPVLFNFFITRPALMRHEPFTFFNLVKSVFAFTYFVTGALLISGIGFIMFKLIPGRSPRKKYLYHVILSKFAGSMIYIMTNVKKTIINEVNETFSKPAVIIANHSSFLDILLMVMLHPKLILLTNKWVWNSPVFGLAVRLAEYYPVAEGAENTIAKLSDKVKEGYSIVVFPEGTRSVDGKIGRFHKGAFYLSQNLNIPVLPILIHGAQYTMTKGFFFLKNGRLTLKMLPRINSDDPEFGTELRDKAKLIGKYFREQHLQLSLELETTGYFKNQLQSNFLFKGPVLEWYMKVKMRLENNYELYNQLVPRKGKITDIGCGYGFLSYMLGYTSKDRMITGVDYDIEKIEIAQNGYLKGENVNFEHADILNYPFKESDTYILNDVLHYLKYENQIELLSACMSNLSANGSVIVRDGISELKDRHIGTRLTELFSTKILGFNKTGKHGLNYISAEMIQNLAKEKGFSVQKIDTAKYTSNVIFILKRSE